MNEVRIALGSYNDNSRPVLALITDAVAQLRKAEAENAALREQVAAHHSGSFCPHYNPCRRAPEIDNLGAHAALMESLVDAQKERAEKAEADNAALRQAVSPMTITPIAWLRRQDVLVYSEVQIAYLHRPADETGNPPVAVYSQDQIDAAMREGKE